MFDIITKFVRVITCLFSMLIMQQFKDLKYLRSSFVSFLNVFGVLFILQIALIMPYFFKVKKRKMSLYVVKERLD